MDDDRETTDTEPATLNDLLRGRLAADHVRQEDLATRVVGHGEDEATDETGETT